MQSTREIKCYVYIYMPSDEIFLSRWIGRLSHCGRYAKTSVIRSEKSFGLLSPNWRLKSQDGGDFPTPSSAMPHNYVLKRGCSTWGRVRRRWSGRRWRNVNLFNEFLHARCSPIIGICLRVLAEVTSKHPVPSVVPSRIVLGDCWRAALKGWHRTRNIIIYITDVIYVKFPAVPINVNIW